jgi:hypothetical protein
MSLPRAVFGCRMMARKRKDDVREDLGIANQYDKENIRRNGWSVWNGDVRTESLSRSINVNLRKVHVKDVRHEYGRIRFHGSNHNKQRTRTRTVRLTMLQI